MSSPKQSEAARRPGLARRARTALRAALELGPAQVLAYAQYRAAMRSGFIPRSAACQMAAAQNLPSHTAQQVAAGFVAGRLLPLPDPAALAACLGVQGLQSLLEEADEICAGQVRLFGGPPVLLQLTCPFPLEPWPAYEGHSWLGEAGDIKFTWEPARFGWALVLARAYAVSRQARYAQVFWDYTRLFFEANPPGLGPQWASAQEVALRLICLVFAWQIFKNVPGADLAAQSAELSRIVAVHAARIPPSLGYARAQNNNHLLSEAAGLYTAGLALPAHPSANRWRSLGWRWFQRGLQQQIAPGGAYSQHSANYHRLMLQLGLWVKALADQAGQAFPGLSLERLSAAAGWLAGLLDPASGQAPNLGANDGALILPLSTQPFADYRPTLQAAGRAFPAPQNAGPLFPPGPWDELGLWLALPPGQALRQLAPAPYPVLRSPSGAAWASLRAEHFTSRPGHADQLHVDLWRAGQNLALDAGTYLYNAPPPWDNALVAAQVHNTVTINGQDQMQRAGRFLYLQPAQGSITERLAGPGGDWERLTARHTGYCRLGVWHVRSLARLGENWQVDDQLLPVAALGPQTYQARLHWLLPDLDWRLEPHPSGLSLFLSSPSLHLELRLAAAGAEPPAYLLARAGQRLAGAGEPDPTSGWVSPTYGHKLPALSLALTTSGPLPLSFSSLWLFNRN